MTGHRGQRLADYWRLTKPDVNVLIGVTTAVGFCIGARSSGGTVSAVRLLHTVVGTLLVASGTGTLNQVIERRFDALMRRTSRRPVASGRVAASCAAVFGLLLAAAGALLLAIAVNMLSMGLAIATMAIYLLVYTPLKRKSSLCTLVGALPGAAPPLIGWAAATGSLSIEAWILYGIVFLWQFPHFTAIAWMYREDYGRAGYHVLPRHTTGATVIFWQAIVPLIVLMPLSLAPIVLGHAGLGYLLTAVSLGGWFVVRADRLAAEQSNAAARRLLGTSIAYLGLLFVVLLLDHI